MDWVKYNGDYKKDFHHVKLFDGTIAYHCYPNAGKWTCHDDPKKVFLNSDIEYIHIFTERDWNMYIWKD